MMISISIRSISISMIIIMSSSSSGGGGGGGGGSSSSSRPRSLPRADHHRLATLRLPLKRYSSGGGAGSLIIVIVVAITANYPPLGVIIIITTNIIGGTCSFRCRRSLPRTGGGTPSPPIKSLDFRGFDSSRLLILRVGNSHVRRI